MTIPQGNNIQINGNSGEGENKRETDESIEKSKLKKTASCEPEKPKSMYKLLASKFNRSGSNVPETTDYINTNEKRCEEDENEKEDKFSLKRPSRFIKKAEKSSSRTSLNETAEDDLSDRIDRKPSKKLSDALNKFLGRKDSREEQSRKSSREESRSTHTPSPQPSTITDTLATNEVADPSKLPRVKPKKFLMSQENLNRVDEAVENGLPISTEQKDIIVESGGQQTDVTLESVTKSICDHLSQLENDITSRIGNIGVNERDVESGLLNDIENKRSEEGKDIEVTNITSDGIKTSPSKSKLALTNTQIPSPVSNYGLSPAMANRRNARPTNLDLAVTGTDSKKQIPSNLPVLNSPTQRGVIMANNREVTNNSPKPFPLTSPTSPASPTNEIQNNYVSGTNNNPNTNMNINNNIKSNGNVSKGQIELNENDTVKFARIKRIGGGEGLEDESLTPTESGSTTSGNDEGRSSAVSDQEDESVMDRIMRKSYYSRFQEAKKPTATRKVNTKESIDQQLAAAKTRLMVEDQQKAIRALSPPRRDAMSPSRVTSPMSPRNSMMNPPNYSEPNRRQSRQSMPPEEYNQHFGNGSRRSSSIQRDDPPSMRRLTSMPPEEKIKRRFSSVTRDVTREESAPRRINRTSVPRDDMVNYRRTTPQRDMYPTSNNYRSKEDLTDESGQAQEVVAVAAAAGAAAGVAASIAATERAGSRSRESSLSRLKSPEPQGPRGWTPTRDETLNNAREELSRRIGHLTRFSGAGNNSNSNNSNSNNTNNSNKANPNGRVIRPYGRTSTTQVYPPPPPFTPSGGNNANPGSRLPDRPAYRRTNTMDLPPSEAQARPGSEYRRMLHDPARRYSATRWVP